MTFPLTEEQTTEALSASCGCSVTVDMHAKTFIWFDESEQLFCVNGFDYDPVTELVYMTPYPIATFEKGSL